MASCAWNLCAEEGCKPDSGFDQTAEGRLVTKDGNNTELKITVVDEDGNPVPNAKLNVWGIAFTSQPKPADLIDEWISLGKGETDTAGELSFSISQPGITDVQIDAFDLSNRGLVGVARIDKWNMERGTPIKVVLAKSKEFTGRLTDYDRQSPVESALVQLFERAKNRAGWINTGRSAESDRNGRFSFLRLIADGDYRIRVTHPDYHRFDGYDLAFSLKYKFFEKETTVKLLSKNAYRRVMESARLSMPETSGLPESKKFELLSKRYDADQVINEQIVSQNIQFLQRATSAQKMDPFHQFMVRTRLHPIDLYRDAIWKLAGTDGSTETQYRALTWLADSEHTDNPYKKFIVGTWPIELKNARDPQENQRLAEDLVDRFVESGLLADDMTSFVRTYHPDPEKALTRVLDHHPNRVVQASAAVELGNHLSYYHPEVRATSIIKNVAQRQIQERRIWELVKNKYDDVELGSRKVTAGETASRRIEFLDNFGVGGQSPKLSGKTMSGETVRLRDYDGKLTILHFCRNQRLEIYDDLRYLKDQYPNSVRLLGVAYYGQRNAESLLARNDVNWPALLDPRPNGLTYSTGGSLSFSLAQPLRWGSEDILGMENFETFVIDKTGKILAVGLPGPELKAFVAELMVN